MKERADTPRPSPRTRPPVATRAERAASRHGLTVLACPGWTPGGVGTWEEPAWAVRETLTLTRGRHSGTPMEGRVPSTGQPAALTSGHAPRGGAGVAGVRAPGRAALPAQRTRPGSAHREPPLPTGPEHWEGTWGGVRLLTTSGPRGRTPRPRISDVGGGAAAQPQLFAKCHGACLLQCGKLQLPGRETRRGGRGAVCCPRPASRCPRDVSKPPGVRPQLRGGCED